MSVSAEIKSDSVASLIKRLQAISGDLRPAMDDIGGILLTRIAQGFESSTDPWGAKWKPLTQSTILQRLMKNKGNFNKKSGKISAKGQGSAMGGFRPLMSSGLLRNSITQKADSASLTIGTNIVYAKMQQFGASQGQFGKTRRNAPIPWGNVPARPFLPILNTGKAMLPPDWQMEIMLALLSRINAATAGSHG